MMEEFEKLKAVNVDFRLRLFLFLSPLEVELYKHVGTVSKDNRINIEQQYVDTINGVLEQTYNFDEEKDRLSSFKCTAYNGETSARLSIHALPTVKTSLKGSSAPSSCPSSPSLVSRQLALYLKHVGASNSNSSDTLSNASLSPRLLVSAAQELDQDASGNSLRMSYFGHQCQRPLEASRMMCYEAPDPEVTSRQLPQTSMHCIGNLSKLVCQSEQYINQGTATGHVEQMQDMHHSPELVTGHGESLHYYQRHKSNFRNLSHQDHHQQRNVKQQGLAWQLHMNGNDGKAETLQHSPGLRVYSQGSSQLHLQKTHHQMHQTLVSFDESFSSNNYNLYQGSQLSHTRIPPASAPMVQLHSALSFPRAALHDYVGRCTCGYPYSQVYQGINVSDDHYFRPVHFNDKPAGKTRLLRMEHTCDPYTWQQHSFFTTPIEREQLESMREVQQRSHGTWLGNCVSNCGDVPSYADACFPIDMSNEENPFVCPCTGCCCHGRQNTVNAAQLLQSNEQDTLPDRSMDEEKPFPISTHGKISFHHDEHTRHKEKCTKGNCGADLNCAQGKCESQTTGMAGASIENFARCVNRGIPLEKELVSQKTSTHLHRDSDCGMKLLDLKSSTSSADLWNKPSHKPIVWVDEPFSLYAQSPKLIEQDYGSTELNLIHSNKFAETYSVRAVDHELPFSMTATESSFNTCSDKFSETCSGTAVDSEPPFNMTAMEISFSAFSSPVYDQSPLQSKGSSFTSFEKEASHMSVTRHLADAMISSVLESFSTEDSYEKNKKQNSGMAGIEMQRVVNCESHQASEVNTHLMTRIRPAGAWSDKKADITNNWLEVGVEKELSAKLVTVEHSGVTDIQADEEIDVDSGNASSDKFKDLLGLQAEAEAIAQGLQIIRNADLEDLKVLGSGTFGTVYHGKWRGSDVAIKRIKASCFTGSPSDQERLISDFWKEACTLGKMHHPNIVAFYGVVLDGPGGSLATVTEFMANGSLKQVLCKKDRTINRRKRLFIAMDAAFGMEYLHSKNIVHFDLKCENLLVNMRDAHRPICKVGDFGLSKVKHHTLVSGGVRGTLPWMAPELLSGTCGMVTEKVDVYSFGIVMWELLTGEEPYANMRCGAIIGGIVNSTLRPSIPAWCDPGWRQLMERCWSSDPLDRPTFLEIANELRAIAASMNMK